MFAASCCDIQGLGEKISELNSVTEVVKPTCFRERSTVPEDYRALGQWIMGVKALTTQELNRKLDALLHRRWATWQILVAPEDVVCKDASMSPVNTDVRVYSPSLLLRYGGTDTDDPEDHARS